MSSRVSNLYYLYIGDIPGPLRVESEGLYWALHKNEQIVRWGIPPKLIYLFHLVSTIGTSIDFFDPEKVVLDAHFRH